MEPVDNDDERIQGLLADYREGFAPAAGSRERVWQEVSLASSEPIPAPFRWGRLRWGMWIAGPLTAAAAAAWLMGWGHAWSMRAPVPVPDAAAYHVDVERERSTMTETRPRSRSASFEPGQLEPALEGSATISTELPLEGIVPEPAPSPVPPRLRVRSMSPRGPSRESPMPAGPRIAALVAVLEQVDRSLHAGDPTEALAVLARHRDELVAAGLGEEHDAYELVARCDIATGTSLEGLEARFKNRYSGSMYAQRIARACGSNE